MANLKNTTIDGTVFRLPAGDESSRTSSPSGRELRFNINTGQIEHYRLNPQLWLPTINSGVIATGGDAVYDISTETTVYRVHVFSSVGTSTFEVKQPGTVEALIVGGGGGGGGTGGGNPQSGGGGAGGMQEVTVQVDSQSYTINIGAGGTGGTGFEDGSNGESSSAFGFTSPGGGGGGGSSDASMNPGGNGASGGGAGGGDNVTGQNKSGTHGGSIWHKGNGAATGISGFGFDGGAGEDNTIGDQGGGGGGGASEPGYDFTNDQRGSTFAQEGGGKGGDGLPSNMSGIYFWYCGGGGAGGERIDIASNRQIGGLGGGGTGMAENAALPRDHDAAPNTGGGGGGLQANSAPAGNGGSGLVIIRYPLQKQNPIAAPSAATDGLVVDIDFGKSQVYSRSTAVRRQSTVIQDSRGRPLTESGINGTVPSYPQTHRGSFVFDGSNDYVDLGIINEEILTMSCLFRSDQSFNNDNGVFLLYTAAEGSSTGFGLHIGGWTSGIGDETFMVTTYPYENQIDYNGSVDGQSDTWFYFVASWDGTKYQLYLNGSSIPTQSQNSSSGIVQPGNRWYIGGGVERNNRFFDGDIAIVKMYNRSLTAQEISDDYETVRWRYGI